MQPVNLLPPCITGYIGVHRMPSFPRDQRFKAQLKNKIIGIFDTAVDAAVAYARARARLERAGVRVGRCHPLRRSSPAHYLASAYSDSEEELGEEEEAEELHSEVNGLRLYLSVGRGGVPKNPTGAAHFRPATVSLVRQHTHTPSWKRSR